MNEKIRLKKQETIEAIAQLIKSSTTVVIAENKGLTVANLEVLRKKLRSENVSIKVYKNSLVTRALQLLDLSFPKQLEGPNIFIFSEDAVTGPKLVAEFAKKNNKLSIVQGIIEGKVATGTDIKNLASLPNREGLISMLLGCLTSPIRSVAVAMKQVGEKIGG